MAAPIRQTLLDLAQDIKNYLVSDVDQSKVSGNNRVKYEFVATQLSMHKRRHYCPKWRNHKYEMRYI